MFDSQKNAFYFAFQINVLFQRCTILWTILSRTKKRFTLISCKHTYSARAVSKHFQFDTKQQQQQQNKITIIAETEFEFIRLCCHSTESLFYYKQKTIHVPNLANNEKGKEEWKTVVGLPELCNPSTQHTFYKTCENFPSTFRIIFHPLNVNKIWTVSLSYHKVYKTHSSIYFTALMCEHECVSLFVFFCCWKLSLPHLFATVRMKNANTKYHDTRHCRCYAIPPFRPLTLSE